MGDVIHTLPAISDIATVYPEAKIDWVVEKSFAEIPLWHSQVRKVIPVALRRWRKSPWKAFRSGEWRECKMRLRAKHYDYVIDAQGLMKSAFLMRYTQGKRCGLDRRSARESIASLAYKHKYSVAQKQHAVKRVRELFSQSLGFVQPTIDPVYGINRRNLPEVDIDMTNTLVFLHGTTWETKHYPEAYWLELAKLALASGYRVKLPWGNIKEKDRAERIAAVCEGVSLLPRMSIGEVASVLAASCGVLAVDTGLGHLACALEVPTVSLYGPTNPELTGTFGIKQKHMAARFQCAPCLSRRCQYKEPSVIQPPCFATITPQQVWAQTVKFFKAHEVQ